MLQSHVIEVDGVFVGVAIQLDRGYRFVATDFRLGDLDATILPTLEEVRRFARRTLLAATSAGPIQAAPHATATQAGR
jgi:hypothetical protein